MNTFGIGGANAEAELKAMKPLEGNVKSIEKEEYKQRIHKVCQFMKADNVKPQKKVRKCCPDLLPVSICG